MPEYVRVTSKEEEEPRPQTMWAVVLKRLPGFTLYEKVDKEGNDFAYYKKDGTLVVPQWLIQNALISKELPAVMNKHYGWLEVVGEPTPVSEPLTMEDLHSIGDQLRVKREKREKRGKRNQSRSGSLSLKEVR